MKFWEVVWIALGVASGAQHWVTDSTDSLIVMCFAFTMARLSGMDEGRRSAK